MSEIIENPSDHAKWRADPFSQGVHAITYIPRILFPGSIPPRSYKLAYGNLKLSGTILIWSVAVPESCPDASEACLKVCYGRKGMYRSPYARKSVLDNLEYAMLSTFENDMSLILRSLLAKPGTAILRIHEIGDFIDIAYAKQWVNICKYLENELPEIIIYFYTKSYFIKNLDWPDNVKIWYSVGGKNDDKYPKNANLAYVLEKDIDAEEATKAGIYLCPGLHIKGPGQWYVCGRDCFYCFRQKNNSGKKVGFTRH